MEAPPSPTRAEIGVVLGITWLAALVRLVAMFRLGQHIDEAASAMAAVCTARLGAPMFPSGVLYLQGATLSYLLAPAISLGLDPESPWVRLVSVAPGVASVPLAFVVARQLGLSRFAALVATAWLALDPLAVEWSAHLRPYAMLQFFTLLATASFLAIRPGAVVAWVGWAVALVLGVYTHVGIVLLLPALAVLTLAQDLRDRLRWAALLVAGLAPASILVINGLFGVSSSGDADPGLLSFVGNHLLSLRGLWSPDFSGWTGMYSTPGMRAIVAVAAGVMVGRSRNPADRSVLTLYSVPVLLVSAFTVDQMGRYLLLVSAFGWMMLASAVERVSGARAVVLLAVGAAICVANGNALYSVYRNPAVDPDYARAFAFVRARKQPGDAVLSGMTPAVWLAQKGSGEDLVFLAGPANTKRAMRYTRPGPDGRIDYWANVPAITTLATLCAALSSEKRPWLILDEERLEFAFPGVMGEVLRGSSRLAWRGPQGTMVHRAEPVIRWSPAARRYCHVVDKPAEKPEETEPEVALPL